MSQRPLIEAELAQTRARLANHLGELEAAANPRRLKLEATVLVRTRVIRLTRKVRRAAVSNPEAAVALGAAFAWLAVSALTLRKSKR